jgi:hypothetical protein
MMASNPTSVDKEHDVKKEDPPKPWDIDAIRGGFNDPVVVDADMAFPMRKRTIYEDKRVAAVVT